MARGLNIVVLSGHLTKDPELKYTPSGIAVSTVSIAVDDPFTNGGGEKHTNFFDLVLWREQAEFAANYLAKGRRVELHGRLKQRKYTEQGTGKRRSVVEVIVNNISPTDRPEDSEPADDAVGAEHPEEG